MSASPPSLDEVRRDAATLRELLTASLWGVELRSVTLGEDESPLIRAFWREVGWDEPLSTFIGHPQIEAGKQTSRELLADYARWGSPLTASSLPSRFRLVESDADGVGFAVTDESAGALDPPVVALAADTGTVERIGQSYLRWAAFSLVAAATHDWHHAEVTTDPPLRELARERPLPHLAPAVRRLSEDLWVLPREPDAEDLRNEVAIRSFHGLWRWLATAKGPRRMSIDRIPGHRRTLSVSADVVRAFVGGWRAIDGLPPAATYCVGALGTTPVIIQPGDPSTLACSARDEQAVEAELATRGWRR